ncbi:MAG TPA: MarC family protein [Calditrichae bacterium]|nr:MarC family protein [Calditrichia bacterium]
MKQDLLFLITVFMGFFAIMNPIGNIPIFLGLTSDFSPEDQKEIARKSVVQAYGIVTVFVVFGSVIFKLFGISLPAFQIAGGILVFLIGLDLLHARHSRMHQPRPEVPLPEESPDDIALTPLATPILAGPGTISTAINFAGEGGHWIRIVEVLFVFAIICGLTYVAFILSNRITRIVRPRVIRLIGRLMGLILTIMAAQMVLSGIFRAIAMMGK